MSTLGPAFTYSPSSASTSSSSKHAPNPSLSSTHSRATTSSGSNRSSYTSYTSSYCSYRESDRDEDEFDDDRSILEDLLDNLTTRTSVLEPAESPPRIPRDSSHQLRERTRYRSSASIHPLAAPEPATSSSRSMDLSAFLASLPPSLDKCFCGNDVEEDSIYCSRLCAQEDALNALCGTSSGAEDSDRASLVSGSSGSAASQTGESHYRRVEREEVRREKERQAKLARERAVARRRAREGESVSSAGSSGSKKGSLWRSNADVGSLKTTSSSSSNRAETPSLSSSISSLSSTSSPISPSFPPSASARVPQLATPVIFAPPRPTTPSPPSPLRDMSDIYSSYLATTPLAPASSDSKLLRTPRQHDSAYPNSTPRSMYPQTPFDEEDDSPTSRAARLRAQHQSPPAPGCGVSDVGLRMLELCSSYPSSPDLLSESLDQVHTEAPSLGWGHREMQERMSRKQGRNGPSSGHTKGKLSFEDVVGILGA